MDKTHHIEIPLHSFFSQLEYAGISVSTRQAIQIQYLIDKFAGELSARDLGNLIVPILAKNRTDQQVVFELFESLFLQQSLKETEELVVKKRRKSRYPTYLYFSPLILLIFLLVINSINPPKPNTYFSIENSDCLRIGDPVTLTDLTSAGKYSFLMGSTKNWEIEGEVFNELPQPLIFSQVGIITISLHVTNTFWNQKADSTYSNQVEVLPSYFYSTPPSVDIQYSPSNPVLGDSIRFSVNGDTNYNYKFKWIIGGDTIFQEQAYYHLEEYKDLLVNLTVFNFQDSSLVGCSSSNSTYISFSEDNLPQPQTNQKRIFLSPIIYIFLV